MISGTTLSMNIVVILEIYSQLLDPERNYVPFYRFPIGPL